MPGPERLYRNSCLAAARIAIAAVLGLFEIATVSLCTSQRTDVICESAATTTFARPCDFVYLTVPTSVWVVIGLLMPTALLATAKHKSSNNSQHLTPIPGAPTSYTVSDVLVVVGTIVIGLSMLYLIAIGFAVLGVSLEHNCASFMEWIAFALAAGLRLLLHVLLFGLCVKWCVDIGRSHAVKQA